MSGIYKITNIINNKLYVGSTSSNFNKRWNCHKSTLRRNLHGNKYLQNSWNKYGEQSFDFEIIENINTPSREILIEKEIFYKNLLNAQYNIAPIDRPFGSINLGRKHKPETIEKMKLAHKGHKMPSWFGEYIRKIKTGQTHSLKTRLKISKNCKGKNKGKKKSPFTVEHIKNLSVSHIGTNRGSNHGVFGGKFEFYHPIYGTEILGRCDLIRKYNIKNYSKIYQICNGNRKSYMGWICFGKLPLSFNK